MKTSLYAVLAATVALSAPQTASAQIFGGKPKIEASYLVISKSSGLFAEADKSVVDAAFVYVTKNEIEETASGRNKHRRIQIITTTEATNAVFSGSGEELQRDGGRVFERVSPFQPRCNDNTRVYANIARDIEVNGYESIRIVHIGPFVNAPAPCEDQEDIRVPQAITQDVALADILSNAKRADFTAMMVHPDQYAPLLDYLDGHELSGRDTHSIEILRPDETRTRINFIEAAAVASTGGSE